MIILAEYLELSDIFLKKLVAEPPKYFDINKTLIDLNINKKSPYKLIYSLAPLKLKTFNTYIEINPTNGFIRPYKL